MDREIKSRGIPIDKPKDSGEFVYGYYLPFYTPSDTHPRFKIEHRIYTYLEEANCSIHNEVHPDTVGQYRGKDDDDKEIYDGSLITFIPKDASALIQQIAEVYYCEKRKMTCVKSTAWDCPLFNCKKIEVIGNVHTEVHDKEQNNG